MLDILNTTTGFIVVFVGMTVPTLVAFILWNVMYLMLCRKYDALLFKSPYFRKNELLLYATWPLGLLKIVAYMLLLAVPEVSKKKRFNSLDVDLSGDKVLVFLSRLFFVLAGMGVFFIFMLFLWGILTFIEDPLAIKF